MGHGSRHRNHCQQYIVPGEKSLAGVTKALPGRQDVGTGPNCWCDLMQVMSSPMVTLQKIN